MQSFQEFETSVLIKHIEKNLNQINRDYFNGYHGILSVTNSGDYVTVKRQGLFVADYDTQKLFEALENFSEEDREFLFPYDLWNYLEHCKYTPENQESDNKLKTDVDELSLSEKRQVALNELVEELEKKNEILWEKNRELEQNTKFNQTWIENLIQRVHDLESTIYLLQQENKRLKRVIKLREISS